MISSVTRRQDEQQILGDAQKAHESMTNHIGVCTRITDASAKQHLTCQRSFPSQRAMLGNISIKQYLALLFSLCTAYFLFLFSVTTHHHGVRNSVASEIHSLYDCGRSQCRRIQSQLQETRSQHLHRPRKLLTDSGSVDRTCEFEECPIRMARTYLSSTSKHDIIN